MIVIDLYGFETFIETVNEKSNSQTTIFESKFKRRKNNIESNNLTVKIQS